MRLINERTMFKVLVEPKGVLFAVTLKSRAYFFFFSSSFIGAKTAPTTDPFEGIVEICHYEIDSIIRNWERLRLVKRIH